MSSIQLVSDLLRSSSSGVIGGVPFKFFSGKSRARTDFRRKNSSVVMAKIVKIGKLKHEYPWPDELEPDPNVKGGILSYLSEFKPLKEKAKPVTLPFEKPLMDLEKKIMDVQKMAAETGLDFTDQMLSLESKYEKALKV